MFHLCLLKEGEAVLPTSNISGIPYLVRSDIFDKSKVLLKPDGFSGILSAFIKLCEAQYHLRSK